MEFLFLEKKENELISFDLLQVVLVQQDSIDCITRKEVEQNIEKTLSWVDKVCNTFPEVDLIVFPECGIQGAASNPNPDVPFEVPGPEMQILLDKCFERKVWAEFNFLEKYEDKVFNTSIIVNDDGKIALKYRKVNTFEPIEGHYPGSEFNVCRGPKGAVFGIMACYDGDFPEVGRELAYMGCNVMIRPSAYPCPYTIPWEFTNRARAYENMAYVLACNRVANGENVFFGKSVVVDFDGRVLFQALPGVESLIKADIFPGLVDWYRKERKVANHLYNIKHRGYSVVKPNGLTDNPYKLSKGW